MSIFCLSTAVRTAGRITLWVSVLVVFAVTTASNQSPRFYPDDPISRAPESQSASSATPYAQVELYELVYNLFVRPGYQPSGLRAKNLNTIDEVPDSSWFTNRVGVRPVTIDELSRGANVSAPPDLPSGC